MKPSAKKDAADVESTPWIRTRDFAEVSFFLKVVNNTTRTEVPRSKATEVTEFSEVGLLLRLPSRSCAQGHLLTLHLERRRLKPFVRPDSKKQNARLWVIEDQIQLTAKVREVEPLKPGFDAVEVHFYQCDQEHWELFLKDLIERQKALNQVVRNIKE